MSVKMFVAALLGMILFVPSAASAQDRTVVRPYVGTGPASVTVDVNTGITHTKYACEDNAGLLLVAAACIPVHAGDTVALAINDDTGAQLSGKYYIYSSDNRALSSGLFCGALRGIRIPEAGAELVVPIGPAFKYPVYAGIDDACGGLHPATRGTVTASIHTA